MGVRAALGVDVVDVLAAKQMVMVMVIVGGTRCSVLFPGLVCGGVG